MNRNSLVGCTLPVTFLLTAILLSPAFGQPPPGPPGMGKPENTKNYVLIEKVVLTTPVDQRKYVGKIEAIEKVSEVARVSGYLNHVAFKEGNVVKKGDLLFEIEDSEYVANVYEAEAAVVEAKANILENEAAIHEREADILEQQAAVEYRNNSYNRYKKLNTSDMKAVSDEDVQNSKNEFEGAIAREKAAQAALARAKAQLESAKAVLNSKQARLDIAKLNLSYTKIYSKITGKTGRLAFTEGNYVTPSSGALVTVAMPDPIYVRFSISETEFVPIQANLKQWQQSEICQIQLADGSFYEKRGQLLFFDNQLDDTNSIILWAQFDNPNGVLNPGGIVKVYFNISDGQPLPAIKSTAILYDSKGEFVYMVDEDHKAFKRRVEIGPEAHQLRCIRSGLKEGDSVIVGGTNKVLEGMVVEQGRGNK